MEKDYLPISKLHELIIDKRMNNTELGNKIRELYWDMRSFLDKNK